MADVRVILVSAVALVDDVGRVLLAQRPAGKNLAGYWEFPGGKLEAGEAPEDALIRELNEELGITVARDDLEPLTFASHPYDKFHLLMPLFLCWRWQGLVVAREHSALEWVAPDRLMDYALAPADIPLVPQLRARL